MKTIKVIDLIILKKYNDLEMPYHIKINKLNYFYNKNRKTYDSEYGEQMSFDFTDNVLNMEVEIIEESEQDIDIQNIEELLIEQLTERKYNNADIYMLGKNVNVLIRAVKQLDNKIKEI